MSTSADIIGQYPDLPCASVLELFFAEAPADLEAAKALCRGCRALAGCLAGALDRREPWGFWGGELLVRGAVVPRKLPHGPSSQPPARPNRRQTAVARARPALPRGQAGVKTEAAGGSAHFRRSCYVPGAGSASRRCSAWAIAATTAPGGSEASSSAQMTQRAMIGPIGRRP